MQRATQEQLKAVNDRLRKGEGWIGYRNIGKHADGTKKESKSLYFSFYRSKKQVFVNSETNDPEEAYKQLLDARSMTFKDGANVLPQEVKKLRYEDLRRILIDHYHEHHPDSITGKDENGVVKFAGSIWLDEYFGGMSVSEITATEIQKFIKWRKAKGHSGPTIRRQLTPLRSAFERAKELDLLTDNHIPSFVLPKDSDPREGFLEPEDFEKLFDKLPNHLKPGALFMYYTGVRKGSAEKVTWGMVSKNNTEITMPGRVNKNRKPHVIPLVGPLEPIVRMLTELRKQFPKTDARVFDFTNQRNIWNQVCADLGFGKYDPKTRKYEGLLMHDFRRSAARNLMKMGVKKELAKRITGHVTDAMFDRYAIQTTDDVAAELKKFKPAKVVELSVTR